MKRMYKIIIALIMVFAFIGILQTTVNAADEEGNFVVVLDPGHGGSDPGAANSKFGLKESDVNYKIAVYAKEELEKYEGVKVYLTRYADCPSIYDRGEFAKNYNADLVVSIHINSSTSQSARGAEIWVTQDNSQVEYYEGSKMVGEKILYRLARLGLQDHGVSTRSGQPNEWYPSGIVKDYYGIIRYPMNYGIRSLLVEHCYISSDADCEQFLNSDAKLKNLGVADALGIVEAYNLQLKGQGREPVRQMHLDKTELELEMSNSNPEPTAQLNTVITPTNAYMQGADWYSSNPDVVRVWNGHIRGLKEGTATITAISWNNQRIAKCTVRVTKPAVPVESITVDKTSQTVNIDETGDIIVQFNPSNATNQNLVWESSDPEVVRIWNGHFRGLKEGKSVITATSIAGGKQASCEIYVKDSSKVYLEDITLEKTQYEIGVDQAIDIPFTITPTNATNGELDWISSNPDVLRVYNNRFRGLKPGTAEVIIRTRSGPVVEKRIQVTIKEPGKVQDIILDQTQYTVHENEAIDIPFSYTPQYASNAEFDWISSNSEIVRVYNNRFRGLKEGTAEVIVRTRDGSLEKRIQVKVVKPGKIYVENVVTDQEEYTAYIGQAIDLTYNYAPANSDNAQFEWYAEDPEIIRVYNNRFRGLAKGTTNIIVKTLDGLYVKKIKVTIQDAGNVQDIQLDKIQYTINENEAVDIPFSYTPQYASNAEFDWISSNPEVVRVYNNRFRGLKEGIAEVIVRTRDGSLEKRITVRVEKTGKVYVEDIMTDKEQYIAKVDEAVDLTYTCTPQNSQNAQLEWYAENPEIIRVYNNRFRGLKKGTTYIVVRTLDGMFEKKIKVTIQ